MSRIFQVGDEAELGPILMNRFIGEVVAQGGEVVLKGNKATIVSMPGGPIAAEPLPVVEEEPAPAPAPKKTAPRKKAPTPPED